MSRAKGPQELPGRVGRHPTGLELLERGGLFAPGQVTKGPQVPVAQLAPGPGAFLGAEEDLDDHERWQCPQVHLAGLCGTALSRLEGPAVQAGVAPAGHPPALVVGVAIAAGAVGRPGAGCYEARPVLRHGPGTPVGQELFEPDGPPHGAELLGVRLAQDRPANRRLALAPCHRAALGRRGRWW